ncbi:(S)-benzoin forming benzil reductase [Metabacillus sp. 84]|uniref:(S)-benzoin forming benzil reductase n=1 Tax=Metabacillus sp. 84 TaxID=3404705 RepID=UPI003CEB0EDD
MKTYIVTGTSRGLGAAMAEQLIHPEHHIICISRKKNTELCRKAKEKHTALFEIEADLTVHAQIPAVMETVFNQLPLPDLHSLFLINNAGMVHPVDFIEKASASDMARNISLNLLAPMILTSEFIKRSAALKLEKRIMNISSGAARKPYEAWSSYCASKAGLDHFTRCTAEEQKQREDGVKCVSIAPGVIDTGMQDHIRGLEEGRFPEQSRFIRLKEEGKLYSASLAAEKLLEVLHSETFGQEVLMDIRNV